MFILQFEIIHAQNGTEKNKQNTSLKRYKNEIKILANPGLA